MLPLNEVKGQRLRVKRDLSIPVTFITNFYFPQTCAEDAENPQRSLRDRLIFISKSELRKRQKICGYSAYSKNLTCKFSASLMIIFLPQISQITQINKSTSNKISAQNLRDLRDLREIFFSLAPYETEIF